MEASRIKPASNQKLYIATSAIMVILLLVVMSTKLSFAQTGSFSGNNIAAVYSTDPSDFPFGLKVYQNYPNPFSTTTSINFETASFANLKLAIYDQSGNLVKAYIFDNIGPGTHEVRVDGNDFPAGEYTYRFISGNYSQTYNMTVVK